MTDKLKRMLEKFDSERKLLLNRGCTGFSISIYSKVKAEDLVSDILKYLPYMNKKHTKNVNCGMFED